ncbi:hypothetical protein A3A38_03685 [Candidatus Kaiserbacteria bacterium RIFCSPLOWO2_01_FULL_53_17]|uniref:Pyridoxamine 5'-phosphate oxidase N-terminal domain-containing protein n=1 Tax=Candidatus Kaiserbacteria bacterium RIFCSPLOWO2_01_FULL_53_17 TaxID=1798511 RepID=A0A1F6EGF9_9BACT|nr:MAG: hypothetical protein A3A38_03685 [Candidatus Kaiserbacteria bacterium RIFCSPLOWO2_01_FULL_53_17]
MVESNLERAQRIIAEIKYITLATVAEDGRPWNAPVFTAYDEKYNFFWGSHVGSQHSTNIRSKPDVFLVIYDSTVPGGAGEGVYIQATAVELEDMKEIKRAYKLLEVRHVVPYWKFEQVHDGALIRLYKAVPKKVWVNSEGRIDGHYIDTREEVKLLA